MLADLKLSQKGFFNVELLISFMLFTFFISYFYRLESNYLKFIQNRNKNSKEIANDLILETSCESINEKIFDCKKGKIEWLVIN